MIFFVNVSDEATGFSKTISLTPLFIAPSAISP
jgi:hypothetical protein